MRTFSAALSLLLIITFPVLSNRISDTTENTAQTADQNAGIARGLNTEVDRLKQAIDAINRRIGIG